MKNSKNLAFARFLLYFFYKIVIKSIHSKKKERIVSKLIIFDADGTLFDSHHCIYRVWLKIGEGFGRPNIFKNEQYFEEIYKKHHGKWEDYCTIELGFSENDFEKIVAIWLENVVSVYSKYSEWFEGMVDVLHELEKRGYTIAIATNNAKKLFVKPLSEIGKEYPIHDQISHKDVQKPEPHMILDHMEKLDFSAQDTVMVGDTLVDLQAARRSEVMSIWAKYGSLQDEGQLRGLYDNILETPECLLNIFR